MNILDECIDVMASLPGVGKKTASRYVVHLLRKNKKELIRFCEVLNRALQSIQECPVCHSVTDSSQCSYCSFQRTSTGIICIVQDFRDILSIENTGKYKGTYHVLGGVISPVDGIGPSDLTLSSLDSRIAGGCFEEIIFALGTTREAETTQFYLWKKYEKKVKKFTTLPKGISHGTEIEFADEITLASAFEHRIPLT